MSTDTPPRTPLEARLRAWASTDEAEAVAIQDEGDPSFYVQRASDLVEAAAALARLTERNRALEAELRAILAVAERHPSASMNTIRDAARRALTDTEAPHDGAEEDEPQPIGKCPRCGADWYTDAGFCGGCHAG